jgi:hypothetical protein
MEDIKTVSKFLMLRLARIFCDLAMDFYYFRKIDEKVKEKKMAIVNSVREDVIEELKKEQVKSLK